jgi:hypothetical protein
VGRTLHPESKTRAGAETRTPRETVWMDAVNVRLEVMAAKARQDVPFLMATSL